MKVLFLDHDGVICIDCSEQTRHLDRLNCFDVRAIKILNDIIDQTGCEIVVSSDWRYNLTLGQMCKLYDNEGINKSPIGYTPIYGNYDYNEIQKVRSYEILKWIKNNPDVTSWVAVDDLDLSEWIPNNFIHVKFNKGITQIGAKEKIIEILNS